MAEITSKKYDSSLLFCELFCTFLSLVRDKIKRDAEFRGKEYKKGKSYILSTKEYRCLKALKAFEEIKEEKESTSKKKDN